jgi:hypothetical protein
VRSFGLNLLDGLMVSLERKHERMHMVVDLAGCGAPAGGTEQ